eukprot:Hpha_TRINITY_DN19980_c0_g1::TRINITY_DN19980_c0_g1_i1::g.93545::m.93545
MVYRSAAALAALAPLAVCSSSLNWNTIPPGGVPPPPRRGACGVVLANGTLWMFGGRDLRVRGDVWERRGGLWEMQYSLGGPGQQTGAVCWVDGDNVRVFGGRSPLGFSGEMWMYSISGNTWTAEPSQSLCGSRSRCMWPPDRTGAALFVVDSRSVGLHGGRGPAGLLSDTWIWDTAGWRLIDVLSPLPPGRVEHGAIFLSGELFIVGGEGKVATTEWLRTVWALNLTSRRWRSMPT